MVSLAVVCLTSIKAEELKFESYFSGQFGALQWVDVYYHEYSPKNRKGSPTFFYVSKIRKLDYSNLLKINATTVTFSRPDLRNKVRSLWMKNPNMSITLLGYESIRAQGQPHLTKGVDRKRHWGISMPGWHAERIFEVEAVKIYSKDSKSFIVYPDVDDGVIDAPPNNEGLPILPEIEPKRNKQAQQVAAPNP